MKGGASLLCNAVCGGMRIPNSSVWQPLLPFLTQVVYYNSEYKHTFNVFKCTYLHTFFLQINFLFVSFFPLVNKIKQSQTLIHLCCLDVIIIINIVLLFYIFTIGFQKEKKHRIKINNVWACIKNFIKLFINLKLIFLWLL